jgi:hypothetical protein
MIYQRVVWLLMVGLYKRKYSRSMRSQLLQGTIYHRGQAQVDVELGQGEVALGNPRAAASAYFHAAQLFQLVGVWSLVRKRPNRRTGRNYLLRTMMN